MAYIQSTLLKIHPLLLSMIKINALVLILHRGFSNRSSQIHPLVIVSSSPQLWYQSQREEIPRAFYLLNLPFRISTMPLSADRHDFSLPGCQRDKKEPSVRVSSYKLSQIHMATSRILLLTMLWSWSRRSFVSLGSLKSEDLALLLFHWHTPANEYTGYRQGKKQKQKTTKMTVASGHLLKKNIPWSFFSSVSFRVPKRTPKTPTPPFSCQTLVLKVIRSRVYCN